MRNRCKLLRKPFGRMRHNKKMDTQATREVIIQLVRRIPDSKLESVRDYLAFLALSAQITPITEAQKAEAEQLAGELFGNVTQSQLDAEEAEWDALIDRTKYKLELVAREAHEAYLAGKTTGIDDSGDELRPTP